MRIIGCDLHARQQTLAMLETVSGEVVNRTLLHSVRSVPGETAIQFAAGVEPKCRGPNFVPKKSAGFQTGGWSCCASS
jgi:hypothetical protein